MPGIDELLRIMARLRDPGSGCPWDLEQDFASISPHTIEEAYEVDEAIARGDLAALRDELGDLLFQVVFQARLAEERGAFDFAGVVEAICAKLVRRHPHVFAGAPAPGSAARQVASWEAIKASERDAARSTEDRAASGAGPDPFADVPRALPALTRSAKLAGRMARIRGDGALPVQSPAAMRAAAAQVEAATGRVRCAIARALAADEANGAPDDPTARRAERLALVGEGIRAWAELARQLGVDPELALRQQDDAAVAAARRDARQAGAARDR